LKIRSALLLMRVFEGLHHVGVTHATDPVDDGFFAGHLAFGTVILDGVIHGFSPDGR
jgi:hypothetical protein